MLLAALSCRSYGIVFCWTHLVHSHTHIYFILHASPRCKIPFVPPPLLCVSAQIDGGAHKSKNVVLEVTTCFSRTVLIFLVQFPCMHACMHLLSAYFLSPLLPPLNPCSCVVDGRWRRCHCCRVWQASWFQNWRRSSQL